HAPAGRIGRRKDAAHLRADAERLKVTVADDVRLQGVGEAVAGQDAAAAFRGEQTREALGGRAEVVELGEGESVFRRARRGGVEIDQVVRARDRQGPRPVAIDEAEYCGIRADAEGQAGDGD